MSANCCAQHSLLLAACSETTIHTRALSEKCVQDLLYRTFYLIIKDVLSSCWILADNKWPSSLSICQELHTNCIGKKRGVKVCESLAGGNCASLFHYIGCKGAILQAPSKWWMWRWCVDPELFEMWAVFQWSMYKVHEQKSFSVDKTTPFIRQDLWIIVQLLLMKL